MAEIEVDDDYGAKDGDEPSDPTHIFSLDTASELKTTFADATVAEVIGDTVQISFLERRRGMTRVAWPLEDTQPSWVALQSDVSEVARLRISAATANDLAMNLLLESSRHLSLDEAAFDRNIEIVRAAFRSTMGNRGDG